MAFQSRIAPLLSEIQTGFQYVLYSWTDTGSVMPFPFDALHRIPVCKRTFRLSGFDTVVCESHALALCLALGRIRLWTRFDNPRFLMLPSPFSRLSKSDKE